KSGIPDEVLMPAPVNTAMRRAAAKRPASSEISGSSMTPVSPMRGLRPSGTARQFRTRLFLERPGNADRRRNARPPDRDRADEQAVDAAILSGEGQDQ